MIEIEGLTKCFGDLTAVDNISLTVPKGEFFVILGPNAAGKTTTIKVMSGLMKATSGRCGFAALIQRPTRLRRASAWLTSRIFRSCTTS